MIRAYLNLMSLYLFQKNDMKILDISSDDADLEDVFVINKKLDLVLKKGIIIIWR